MSNLPVDFNLTKNHDPNAALKEYCTGKKEGKLALCAQCCRMKQAIKENMANYQTKEKRYYDLRQNAAPCILWSWLICSQEGFYQRRV